LSILGFFQYIAPTLSLLLAVFYYDETVSDVRWISFSLVWCGLAIFSLESLYHQRQPVVQI
jgi:chloramphenicol-sensitive protein RarD